VFQCKLRVHKQSRLCPLSSCHDVIRSNNVTESVTICYLVIRNMTPLDHVAKTTIWVDREHMQSSMNEYQHSSDEKQFPKDMRLHHDAIFMVGFMSM
jgi:hypothetical protein